MAHEIFRLINKKLFNKPQLIDLESFNEITEYALERGSKDLAINPKSKPNVNIEYSISDGVAYLPVSGALTYEATGFEALCGMMSYQRLQTMFDKSLEQGVHTVVLDVNSPGGEAYGVFETGRYMRDKADEHGIKLIAYIDGLAASAGYGLAASAHEIVSNPQSEAGSIGVVVKLKNPDLDSPSTYVYAGDNKIPYDAEGNFSESFLNDLQDKVDTLYDEFTSYVSEMRNIDTKAVIDTQAKVFMAIDALDIGLVDALLTREEFFEKLAQDKEGGESMPLLNRETGDKKEMSVDTPETSVTPNSEALAEMQAQLASMRTQLEEVNQEKQKLADEAKQAKMASLEDVAKAWEMFGVDSKAYAEAAFEGNVSVDMFNAAMDKASEQLKEQKDLNSSLRDEFEALGEVGVTTAEAPEVEEDGVEKALEQLGKLK